MTAGLGGKDLSENEMTMDVVQRLRCVLKGNPDEQAAADEIERLREALKIVCAATEQLMQAGKEAAEMIYREAVCLRDCHTIDGVWDGQEPEVLEEYEYMIALADRLTPNA